MKKFMLSCAFLLATVGCIEKSEKWVIVIHASGGQIEQTRLVLEDVDQHIVVFTVGAPRKVLTMSLQELVSKWDQIFASSKPNATLSMRTADKEQKEQVVILKKPQLSGHQLTFMVEQLGGSVESSFENAVLFVDPAYPQVLIRTTPKGGHKTTTVVD